MMSGARYVSWVGPVMLIGQVLLCLWAGNVWLCGILGNSLSFVLKVLCLNVSGTSGSKGKGPT